MATATAQAGSTSSGRSAGRARIRGTSAGIAGGSGRGLTNPQQPRVLAVTWSVPVVAGALAGSVPVPPGNAVIWPADRPLDVPGLNNILEVPA